MAAVLAVAEADDTIAKRTVSEKRGAGSGLSPFTSLPSRPARPSTRNTPPNRPAPFYGKNLNDFH